MKTYDEITARVLETAAVRTVKIKRMRYFCTMAAVCSACVIGGAAFMKLEKPEFQPTESQSDPLHSASDPSTEVPTETTAAETTMPTEVTTTVVQTTAPMPVTLPVSSSSVPETRAVTEIVTVYAESSAVPLMSSLPGNTHASSTTRKDTATTYKADMSVATTGAAAETAASETGRPAETVPAVTGTNAPETETAEVIRETVTSVTTAAAPVSVVTAAPVSIETSPRQSSELSPWDFLFDLYVNGELPFSFEEADDVAETMTDVTTTTEITETTGTETTETSAETTETTTETATDTLPEDTVHSKATEQTVTETVTTTA